jgi:hypothetical protein
LVRCRCPPGCSRAAPPFEGGRQSTRPSVAHASLVAVKARPMPRAAATATAHVSPARRVIDRTRTLRQTDSEGSQPTARGATSRAGVARADRSHEEVMSVSRRIYRTGEIVPVSGQYAAVNVNGQETGREVTCVRGEPFPPTRVGDYGYVLRDATVHSPRSPPSTWEVDGASRVGRTALRPALTPLHCGI